ncbi:MAG: accessory factor UbiK family protein [Pseudomonadota bacterium]
MFDPKILEDIAQHVSNALPSGFKDLRHDVEKNLKVALQAGFNKLDLVTREEFDVQAAVLARTRAKLEELERRVVALEHSQPGSASTVGGTADKS